MVEVVWIDGQVYNQVWICPWDGDYDVVLDYFGDRLWCSCSFGVNDVQIERIAALYDINKRRRCATR